MAEDKDTTPFRVIIVGGSVAGLTLANSLSRQNIDFLVLEAHDDIAPPVGAAFGLICHGAMILDQMGMFDDIYEMVEPVREIHSWREGGVSLTQLETPELLQTR